MDLWLPLQSHLLQCLRTFFQISRPLVLLRTTKDYFLLLGEESELFKWSHSYPGVLPYIRSGYKAIGLNEVEEMASEVENGSFSQYGQQKSNNLVETQDTSVKWYSEDPGSRLTPETRAFFLEYTGLSENELLPHLLSIVHCPYQ